MSTLSQFLETLFDPGQATCFSPSPEGIKVYQAPVAQDIFFSINALHPTEDLAPTQSWHDKWKPRRSDKNVVCYRNFLLELDKMALDDQIAYVRSRIPYTTCVYSGGASYHFIVSLETPLQSSAEYQTFARRLHRALPEADPATKNPSRFSRLPFRIRPDTRKLQELISLNERISFAALDKVLPKVEAWTPQTTPRSASYLSALIVYAVEHPDEVMVDRHISGRNMFFYWLHNRLEECGVSGDDKARLVDKAYANLQNKTDFTYSEALQAARIR